MANIKLGVLGLGRMGLIHCGNIKSTPGLVLAAGSSRVEELTRAARERFNIQVYQSHDELLNDPEIKWVVIATTTEKHKKWALKAIDAGKELIIEKPVALSFADTEEIFYAADSKGVRVTVHNNRRWDQDFLLVRKVLKESILGDVYRIESRYTHFSASWGTWGYQGSENPWRLKKIYGGGMLNDWGPHLFDQLLVIADSNVSHLVGKVYGKIWSGEVDDHFWAEVIFENGLSARVEASNNHRIPQSRWCIVGSQGTLEVAGGDPADWNSALVRWEIDGFTEELRYDIPQPELSSGFYPEFAAAVINSKPLPVLPEHVKRVMKLIDAVRASENNMQVIPIGEE